MSCRSIHCDFNNIFKSNGCSSWILGLPGLLLNFKAVRMSGWSSHIFIIFAFFSFLDFLALFWLATLFFNVCSNSFFFLIFKRSSFSWFSSRNPTALLLYKATKSESIKAISERNCSWTIALVPELLVDGMESSGVDTLSEFGSWNCSDSAKTQAERLEQQLDYIQLVLLNELFVLTFPKNSIASLF